MTWASRRKLLYSSIVVAIFLTFIYFGVSSYLNKIPTCTDGRQNGNEAGVDCGGSCSKACSFQVDRVSVLWSRAFKVVDGRYNAVAYLENLNKNLAINKINYKFRFADKDNIYIGKRDGSTFIPPGGKFAIFEPAIDVGNSIPVYTTFEFTETPLWVQVSEEKLDQLKISFLDIKLENENPGSRLSAKMRNNSLFTIPNLDVIAILYDASGTAVSTSRTFIEELGGQENVEINFTWPEKVPEKIIAKELIPMYNVFTAKLK